MNGSAILVVGTTSDYIALLDQAHPTRCLFVTANSERQRYPQFAPKKSPEILTDLEDFDRVLGDIRSRLEERSTCLSGIVCYDCESMNLAAFLAENLNLTYTDSRAIVNCRDKYLSKQLWRSHGLNCARTRTVGTATDIMDFFEDIKGPIVIKPKSGSGSELTFKCTDRSECQEAAKIITSRLTKCKDDRTALDKLCPEDEWHKAGFIVEEFVAGQEYSGDFIIDGEDLKIIRLARKFPAPDQTFGTTLAYMVPAVLPEAIAENDLAGVFKKAAQALGIKRAICMIDFMIDRDKVYLLEMSPRPGGDCLPFLIKHSLGLDIFSLSLDFAEQKPVTLPDMAKAQTHVGVRIFAEQSGTIADILYPALRDDDRVVEAYFKYSRGHKVIMPPDDYDSRILGHIIFRPTAGADILEECRQLASLVKVYMETPFWKNMRLAHQAEGLLNTPTPALDRGMLDEYVRKFIDDREVYLDISRRYQTPLYVLDMRALKGNARKFEETMAAEIPSLQPYYAIKSNNHPFIARTLAEIGFGLDVSSGRELELALNVGASKIIFSGPGKSDDELILALENNDKVILLMDSFGELERVKNIISNRRITLRAGVRLTTQEEGLWRKFGIPLSELNRFFHSAADCPYIKLAGLQFHTSWNMNPQAQIKFIKRLGKELDSLSPETCGRIEFLDIGGGYWPPSGEWLQPAATPEGRLRQCLENTSDTGLAHHHNAAVPIETFALELGQALKEEIFSRIDCTIFAEPGRWISHGAMHILLTVMDKKAPDMVVTDGGINMVGWERYESDYFPIINLSSPDALENICYIFGSLCTPHDVWGYGYHGREINVGDVLLVPDQGAYTYSLRQQFIKPVPDLVVLQEDGLTTEIIKETEDNSSLR